MSQASAYRSPELINFLDGYAGPAEVPYHGGNISIVAVLLYLDGIRIDWRVGTMPDLSWINFDEDAFGGSVPPEKDIMIPLGVDARRRESETSNEFRAGYPGPSAGFAFHTAQESDRVSR